MPRKVWQVDTDNPRAQNIDLWYGETVDLECTFRSYFNLMDIDGATVVLHARTNGMAVSESFQAAGVVGGNGLATVRLRVDDWLPQGLESVDYTLAVVQADGVNVLRGFGTIILRGSSVATGSGPMPESVYTQLSEALSADMVALSNNLAAVIAEIEVGGGGTATNTIGRVDKLWSDEANYVDGTLTFKKIDNPKYILIYSRESPGDVGKEYEWQYTIIGDGANGYPVGSIKEMWRCTTGALYDTLIYWSVYGWAIDDYVWEKAPDFISSGDRRASIVNITDADNETIVFKFQREDVVVVTDRAVTTNGTIIITEQYTNALGVVTGQTARAGSQLINSKFSGGADLTETPDLRSIVAEGNHTSTNIPAIDSKSVMSVRDENTERIALYGAGTTQPGVSAYSTYAPGLIARSVTGPGALLIQGPVSNSVAAKISGELVISDEPTANEGAGQPGGIRLGGRLLTSWDEIEAQIDQSDIADLHAWGRRLPDGTANAASNTAVVINSPMIIASGLGFETSGNYAVCVTAGAEMQVVTNGGWVCIKPSTWTDGIGFRTISMTVPAVANSFEVFEGGTSNGYARIKYPYTTGETNAPPVSYSTDMITWAFAPEQEETHDGVNWTVTVAADQPKMFYKGEGRTGSADRIYSAYPHAFDQGVAVGTLAPVVYDAIITVEHGGKTYRIPAQEVQ